MSIRFTQHARHKFDLLRRHGFEITQEQVEDTLTDPEVVIPQPMSKYIAQKRLTERHILRVVYRQEGEDQVVITFYPGRRERYEGHV